MKVGPPYRLPADKQEKEDRARRLEYWSLFWLATIAVVMYLTMGSSQAMKTAWVEDLLSMIPPAIYLVASKKRRDRPNERFPYGYHEALTLAFLGASVALLLLGAYLAFDAASGLLAGHHPTIGTRTVLDVTAWSGWFMIAALAYSAVPPFILGRMKLPLAEDLHHKTLHADADTNKADWTTATAGILGILGVGMGLWWADGAAALAISLSILKDGATNLKGAFSDVLDERPTTIEGKANPEPEERAIEALRSLRWVRDADVRLRDQGELVTGEAYVVVDGDGTTAERLIEARQAVEDAHWRLHDVVVTLVADLEGEGLAGDLDAEE